jgi:hypothetical protein
MFIPLEPGYFIDHPMILLFVNETSTFGPSRE